jgi:hypothetical protein
LCCDARRYSDVDSRILFGNGVVARLTVIGAIGRDLTDFLFNLIEQWPHL